MQRKLFTHEHLMFRDSFRRFVENEIAPQHAAWEEQGMVPRLLWQHAGSLGFLCTEVPEEYGGGGIQDFRYNAIIGEELMRVGASGVGFGLHSDVVAPYILAYGTPEQKQHWLPGMCRGEKIGAIAMSEPAAGSDLAGLQTTAIWEGDCYRLNGQKIFITNGLLSDLVIVVARTDPGAGHAGFSLLVVERGMPGFERGRRLEKIGLHAQDTAELFFRDVHLPPENLLGQAGQGFCYLTQQLPQERLAIAVIAAAACERAIELTVKYCKERSAFGHPLGHFQNTRFKLAELHTETQIARIFVDRCIEALNQGELSAEDAAMAKWWVTELQKRVVDECLQLHGGYGYMLEYPIAKAYLDARVQTIYGGTTEIMKEIIGRSLGLE